MATKTIVVVGVTGNQGGSVAETFLKESGWKVRGLSRDPSKASAKVLSDKGVEIVKAELDDVESLKAAFKGANVIFGNTDFWQFLQSPAVNEQAVKEGREPNFVAYDKELAQGKNMIDAVAANADALERFVLSTLNGANEFTKGKIQYNLHFDSKWEMAKYLRATYPELAKKTSYLQCGTFASNWRMGMCVPKKKDDGTFVLEIPMGGDRKIPMVDVNADTGNFTKALVELPAGVNLAAAGSYMSWNEWAKAFSDIKGVTCTFQRIGRQWMDENMGPLGKELGDMFDFWDQYGFYGDDSLMKFPWDLGVPVKYKTMEEYIKETDWSSIM